MRIKTIVCKSAIMIKWKNDSNPNYVLEKINSCIHINEQGVFTLRGFESHEYKIVLLSMLTPIEAIPENRLWKLYYDSLKDAYTKGGKVTKTSFLAHFNKRAKDIANIPEEAYHLLTTISFDLRHFPRLMSHDGVLINRNPKLSNAIYKKYLDAVSESKSYLHAVPPQNYQLIRIAISAKSINEAVDKALRTINFYRGIWNFHLTYHQFRLSSGKRQPINQILLGPIYFIYKKNSRTARDSSFWFDPDYFGPVKVVYLDPNKCEQLIKFQRWVLLRISKSGYKNMLFNILYRYVVSLDNLSYHDAFTKLWSVLEYITGTSNSPYALTIKRCSSIYKDTQYPSIVLNHLRETRNKTIHGWHYSSNIEQLLCMLKIHVEDLILFHIRSRYASFEESIQFMDAYCNREKIYHDFALLKKHLKD